MRFCNHAPLLPPPRNRRALDPVLDTVGGMDFAIPFAVKRLDRETRQKEGGAMGFLVEVDLDEFLELMECETEARLRVAEIMERRRRAKKLAAELELVGIDSHKAH